MRTVKHNHRNLKKNEIRTIYLKFNDKYAR